MRNKVQVKVRLSNELHGALQAVAAARGVTVTALVKRALRSEIGHEIGASDRTDSQRQVVLEPPVTTRRDGGDCGAPDAGGAT